jgi:putative resolvase
MVQDYQVSEVVVTCSDRLTRFGLDYLTALFAGYSTKLTILFADEEKTRDLELAENLLAIMALFAGRLYGLWSRKRKALLSCVSRVPHKP